MTDTVKHIAGKRRAPHRNRQSQLKGIVNQTVTAEAKASVRTPENRQKLAEKGSQKAV